MHVLIQPLYHQSHSPVHLADSAGVQCQRALKYQTREIVQSQPTRQPATMLCDQPVCPPIPINTSGTATTSSSTIIPGSRICRRFLSSRWPPTGRSSAQLKINLSACIMKKQHRKPNQPHFPKCQPFLSARQTDCGKITTSGVTMRASKNVRVNWVHYLSSFLPVKIDQYLTMYCKPDETVSNVARTKNPKPPQWSISPIIGGNSSEKSARIATAKSSSIAATIWETVLCLPDLSAARTMPSLAATNRRPVIRNSRLKINKSSGSVHSGKIPMTNYEMNSPTIKTLSVSASISLPKLETSPFLRA